MVVEDEEAIANDGFDEGRVDDSSQNSVASQFQQIHLSRNCGTEELDDSAHHLDEVCGILADSEDTTNQNDLIDEGEGDTDVSNEKRIDHHETAPNSMQKLSASEDQLEQTTNGADQILENFKANINNGAPLADPVNGPMTTEKIHSGDQPTVEKLIPDSVVESLSSSRPQNNLDDLGDKTDTSSPDELLGHEILFDDNICNIVFGDEQSQTNQQYFGGELSFTSIVMRVFPARYFWSTSVYEIRILAITTNPDLIVILRQPKNMDEVHRLLALRGEHGSTVQDNNDFLVAESVIDPKTCKIRLSQLTNPTSLPSRVVSNDSLPLHRISNLNKNDNRKHTCFEILTPTETVNLSPAAYLPPDSSEDLGLKSLHYTHRCEIAIVSTIMKVHLTNFALNGDNDQAWKHQVILGTLHSYVVSGNDKVLKESLTSALAFQNARNGGEGNKIDSFIIDSKDENGSTALHYACSRRKLSTVRLLVEAGADCSIAQHVDDLTPCHICSKGLDEKILSIVLSASYPKRADPNAIDSYGRTPMYLAAVEGKSVDRRSCSEALDLCLSALEAWGGQFSVKFPTGFELLHPVHFVSAQWKSDELRVILSHCKYRYPLHTNSYSGCSVSAQFQYPIHAAIASLRNHIHTADSIFDTEFMPVESALTKTLQTLLDHGFEPNERIEGIVGQGEAIKKLSCFIGFTPLQLLALVASESKSVIELKTKETEEDNLQLTRILRNINNTAQAGAELLMMNGARINMPSPPSSRFNRPTPLGCCSLTMALVADPMAASSRECSPLDKNEVITLFGGSSRVNSLLKAFTNKSAKIVSAFEIGSTSIDSCAPGGSDSTSCAICWSEFRLVSKRKHLCRVSSKFVCQECSTKRVMVNSSEHRISDGQYLLALADAKKMEKKAKVDQEERVPNHRRSVTQARKSLGLESKAKEATNGTTEVTETNFKDRFANAMSGLGQAKDSVLERGAKLESLAEKTESLEQASLDFANMAKELNRSQNSWW